MTRPQVHQKNPPIPDQTELFLDRTARFLMLETQQKRWEAWHQSYPKLMGLLDAK